MCPKNLKKNKYASNGILIQERTQLPALVLAWNCFALLWDVSWVFGRPSETWKALFWSAAGFSYSSLQILLGNEGEETGQPRCSAMRKHTMSMMKPAAAGQWGQAGAIFVRCEQSIERVRSYNVPSPPSPPFLQHWKFSQRETAFLFSWKSWLP